MLINAVEKKSAVLFFGLLALLISAAAVRAASLPDFVDLVQDNENAVVNISAAQKVATQQQSAVEIPGGPGQSPEQQALNELLKRFFGESPGQVPGNAHERSLGSGFIISADGYIVTSAHVVANADQIVVQLSDHSEKDARLVGLDERTDIALLKIDAANLPVIRTGDSDALKVGQWVVAIGEPFGLEHTATQGIVSAVGRALPSDSYVPFIQTDAAVNPGSSGGPLFNTDGEVIGVNSQIYSQSGGYMGLSFAVPINVAMKVADQLKSQGFVNHGWLGVTVQAVDEDLAAAFGLRHPNGALVAEVVPGSPAEKAGIEPGDIILSYNGRQIDQASSLPPLVSETQVNEEVPVEVLRHGDMRILRVHIAPLNGDHAAALPAMPTQTSRLEMDVVNLTDKQRNELNVGQHGVLVSEVEPGPAAEAGIHAGDVLLRIKDHEIDSVTDLTRELGALPRGKPVPVLVQRDGNPLFLALVVPE
jgi:serine protease Do